MAYSPPEGYFDLPWTYVFDADQLTDGQNALNQFVLVQAGLGEFILRRVVGVDRVLSPFGGRFQMRDAVGRYLEEFPVFVTAQKRGEFAILPEIPYPENSDIRFDLYDVLRAPSQAAGFGAVYGNPGIPKFNYTEIDGASTVQNNVTVSLNSSFSTEGIQGGDPGPWQDGVNRYMVLRAVDGTAVNRQVKLHMYKSAAGGAWLEVDAAHAPLVVTDLAGGGVDASEYYAPIRDTDPAVRVVYVVCWVSGDPLGLNGPINPAMIPFSFVTDTWGTLTVASSINAIPPPPAGLAAQILPGGFAVVQRKTDNSLVVGFRLGSVLASPADRSFYIKLELGTLAWDTVPTRIGTTDDTDPQSWTVQGAVIDANATTHWFFLVDDNGAAGATLNIQHQAMHSDGTLQAINTVTIDATLFPIPNPLRPAIRPVSGTPGEVLLPYQNQPGNAANPFRVVFARAIASDTPTWSFEHPIPDQTTASSQVISQLSIVVQNGVFAAYYMLADPAGTGNSFYRYIINFDGVIGHWTAITTWLTVPVAQTDQSTHDTSYFGVAPLSLQFTAQIAFQGVRRQVGRSPLDPSYRYRPKHFAYILKSTITTAGVVGTTPQPAAVIHQRVDDYDFELAQIQILYSGPNGPVSQKTPLTKLLVYDWTRRAIASAPVLDLFYNGAPQSAYRNGAQVPPLFYPRNSTIQVDLYNFVGDSTVLPLEVLINFVGLQRIPC